MFTKDDDDYKAYEKDIATAHFYFGTPTITEFRRMETMTPTGFLSQVSHIHEEETWSEVEHGDLVYYFLSESCSFESPKKLT